MALIRNTDLGAVTLSNRLFTNVVISAMSQPGCIDKIWLATKKGHEIGIAVRWTDRDLQTAVKIAEDENVRMTLEINTIVLFGAGIKKTTAILANSIALQLKEMTGCNPSSITINIVGIRSKQIARRRLRAVYRYEP